MTTMKKNLLLLTILVWSASSFSQTKKDSQYGIPQPKNPNVEGMINDALKLLNDTIGVTISYHITHHDPVNKTSHSTRGTVTIKGEKFYLFTPELEAWYDGTTQWIYQRNNKEVNISSPTESELSTLSPMFIANNYKKYYDGEYIRYTYSTEQEQYIHCLKLIPKDNNNDLDFINFNLFDQSYAPYLIVYNNKSGVKTHVYLDKFDQKTKVTDNQFTFNPQNYPGAEIIDLR